LSFKEWKELRRIMSWLSNNLWIFLSIPYIWIEVMALAILNTSARSLVSIDLESSELASNTPSLLME
jgi:hypothetical protein